MPSCVILFHKFCRCMSCRCLARLQNSCRNATRSSQSESPGWWLFSASNSCTTGRRHRAEAGQNMFQPRPSGCIPSRQCRANDACTPHWSRGHDSWQMAEGEGMMHERLDFHLGKLHYLCLTTDLCLTVPFRNLYYDNQIAALRGKSSPTQNTPSQDGNPVTLLYVIGKQQQHKCTLHACLQGLHA